MWKLAAVMALGGCSFAFVSGPPANHEQLPYFDCSSGRAVPILDTLFTALQITNVAVAASQSDAEWEENFKIDRKASIGLYAGMIALGASGMWYGFTRTGECRRAKASLAVRAGGGFGPPTTTWPPPAAPAPAPAPTAPPVTPPPAAPPTTPSP